MKRNKEDVAKRNWKENGTSVPRMGNPSCEEQVKLVIIRWLADFTSIECYLAFKIEVRVTIHRD